MSSSRSFYCGCDNFVLYGCVSFMNSSDLCKSLVAVSADFPEEVDAIRREVASFEVALAETEREGRDLVIAIVGRVKSGKSSFLNALLFNGESVLPQAATPMTAALTFIRYDETCHAEVEFFSAADWETFKIKAQKCEDERAHVEEVLRKREEDAVREAELNCEDYEPRAITDALIENELRDRLSEDQRAASELVTMAAKSGFDIASYLGKTQRIEGATPLELANKLQDYVGVGGRFTPIVCATTIYLNDSGLKGYCVIDTPGTNDPVISRGKKTQDNLKRADVVFVVSPGGRFFDQRDLTLCSQNLPANGINCFRVVISQFDITVLEHKGLANMSLAPDQRLVDVMGKARKELIGHYQQTILENAKKAEKNQAADQTKWRRLLIKEEGGEEKPNLPLCVSSMAYILHKHWGRLEEREQKVLDQVFNRMIPDFSFDNGEVLRQLSMMDPVFAEVEKIKCEKQKRIEEKKATMSVLPRQRIAEMIGELKQLIAYRIESLETADLAKLETELAERTRLIEQGRSRLNEVFESSLLRARNKFDEMMNEVRESKSRYLQLSVDEESHQTSQVVYEKRGGLGIMDYLFGPKKVTQYYTYQTRYADVYQAVDQVEAFAEKARQSLERGIRSAVDVRALRVEIVRLTMDFLKEGKNRGCDIDALKAQIERTVRSIEVPEADFGDVDYAGLITQSFSGARVEDGQIEVLRASQREAIQNVLVDLETRAKEKSAAIEGSLNRVMNTFVNDLISGLTKEKDELAAAVKDKETTLTLWKSYLPILDRCLS